MKNFHIRCTIFLSSEQQSYTHQIKKYFRSLELPFSTSIFGVAERAKVHQNYIHRDWSLRTIIKELEKFQRHNNLAHHNLKSSLWQLTDNENETITF